MNGLRFLQPNQYQELPPKEVEVTGGGVSFNFLKSSAEPLPTGPEIPEEAVGTKKKRGRKPSNETGIVKANNGGDVIIESLSNYNETNRLLRETLSEVDTLTVDLKQELDSIRSSKIMKGKYNYIGDISANIGSLLSTKIQVIREMNSSIRNATEMDYKRQKDMNIAASQDSDQQIYDLYNAFVNSPISSGMAGLSSLGPSTAQMSLNGTDGIVRVDSGNTLDIGYQNFKQNMTPEQRLMIMEDSVKNVIVYDEATGNKFFDILDANGNPVPDIPRRDPMFLEDFTIDIRNKIAKNVNLGEVLPVVVLNEGKKFDEY